MDPCLREALELLNKQYSEALSSDYYRTGKRLHEIKSLVKDVRPRALKAKVQNLVRGKRVPRDEDATRFFCDAPFNYQNLEDDRSLSEKKVVVYTCIFGGYDEPLPLIYKEPGVDYCFITDEEPENSNNNGWEIKLVDESVEDSFRANRYCKMHPFELFPEYDIAIYVDGNIIPISDISRFANAALISKTGIAAHGHFERTCVYEEAKACLLQKRGDPQGIEEWICFLEEEKMPRNFGLFEMSVIIYDLKNSVAKEFAEQWWDVLMSTKSKRDQLVLPYLVWKMGLQMEDFGIISPSLRENYAFSLRPWHKS